MTIDLEAIAREAGLHITTTMSLKEQYLYSGNFDCRSLAAFANAVLEAAARHVETSFHGYNDEYPSPDSWAHEIRAMKVTP
jgi:hypothetical protein